MMWVCVCRHRPHRHRLAALAFLNVPPARSTSSSTTTTNTTTATTASTSTSQPTNSPPNSIFTAPESPWDHVFSDIEPPPASVPRRPARLTAHATSHKERNGPRPPLVQRASGVRHQRASITAREMSVFDEMFDMIFSAVSGGEGKAPAPPAPSARTPPLPAPTPGIGSTSPGAPLTDLFRTLRRRSSRVRWTSATDEELDRKKETMELFSTDHELLRWVTRELFGEAVARGRNEAAARAMAGSGGAADGEAGLAASSTSTSTGSHGELPINHSIYPHLIAHAMRLFRTTYGNPSLSLALFGHAARVSIPSYVFGCTAPAYNELMEAKWEGWGDLAGVCHALEEMRANGVKIDGRTRIVVERVRREVGEARDGTANPLAQRVWGVLGEAEVMGLLHRIERLALRERTRKAGPSPHEESWKSAVLGPEGGDDGWRFDGWDGDARRGRGQGRRSVGRGEGVVSVI